MAEKLKSKRLDTATMFPMIELFEDSNLSQREFCEQMDLTPHVFSYWLTKYRKSKNNSAVDKERFIPLQVGSPEEQQKAIRKIRINYPDGTLIELPIG